MGEDPWRKRAANPDAFDRMEKGEYERIKPILIGLLDELKCGGKIRTDFKKGEWGRLRGLISQTKNTSESHNRLLHLFERPAKEWLKQVEEIGFKETDMTQMYFVLASTGAILHIEHFKQLVLFVMKDVRSFKVSDFYKTMAEVAPKSWRKLMPFLNSKLRNAFAHGAYALDGENVVLYKDARLDKSEKMSFSDFMILAKKHSVHYVCLIDVLNEKKKDGFFHLA